MKVREMAEALGLRTLCMPDGEREVRGGYAGDLLSWVMGRVPSDAAWITIMTNINVVAVAVLRDVAAVVVAEGSEVPDDVIERAKEQEINLFSSPSDVYTLCAALSRLLE